MKGKGSSVDVAAEYKRMRKTYVGKVSPPIQDKAADVLKVAKQRAFQDKLVKLKNQAAGKLGGATNMVLPKEEYERGMKKARARLESGGVRKTKVRGA